MATIYQFHFSSVLSQIDLETSITSLFLSIIAHRTHFWYHLCILTGLNVKTKDGSHLSFPLFSDLSHSIHCSCWMSHQELVSSNICWFYVLLLHIFPQLSPRKEEINNFFLFYQGNSPCLAKLPLNFTGGLAKILSTSLVKKATD